MLALPGDGIASKTSMPWALFSSICISFQFTVYNSLCLAPLLVAKNPGLFLTL